MEEQVITGLCSNLNICLLEVIVLSLLILGVRISSIRDKDELFLGNDPAKMVKSQHPNCTMWSGETACYWKGEVGLTVFFYLQKTEHLLGAGSLFQWGLPFFFVFVSFVSYPCMFSLQNPDTDTVVVLASCWSLGGVPEVNHWNFRRPSK